MTKKAAMVVQGVNLGAAKMTIVDASLAAKGQAVGGTDEQKVGRLATWYLKNTPKTRIADCSTCGGESDVEEPACPFCGDGEVTDAPAPLAPAGTSGKTAVHDSPPPAPKREGTPSAAQQKPFSGRVPYSPRPAPRPATPVAGSDAVVVDAKGVEVITPPATEEALNAAVQNIGSLMQSAADRLWELGAEIRRVFDASLWTQRKTDDGAARYKSWGQFCEVELGISHGYSLKLMDVAREFSREQVRQIGASKLHITLAVPKGEARDRLLGIAPTVSKADLAKQAKAEAEAAQAEAERPAARDTGRGGKNKTGKGGAGSHLGGPPRTGGRKPEKITVAMLTGRVELCPVNVKGAKVKVKIPTAPAVAEERMFNGVKQRIIVTNDDDGFLLVIVERVRE